VQNRRPACGSDRGRLRPSLAPARRIGFGAGLAALALALVVAARPGSAQEPEPAGEGAGPTQRVSAARSLADRKQFAAAAEILREVVREEPENTAALALLARVLAWGRHFDESIRVYERLLTVTADGALDRAGYARVLAWSGRYAPALREFRRALEADAMNLETRLGYARAMSWAGDLAGASQEYARILDADSSYGDAWLGLATTARWRGAAPAGDRFLARAAARGADADGVREEQEALARGLAARIGSGWQITRERQYVSGSTPFTIESSGPFAVGTATPGRAVGLGVRAGRYRLWERRAALPSDTTLNYDLRASILSGDLSFLRAYSLQLAAGATVERLEPRSTHVLYPLGGDRTFVGARGRLWGYWGRLTPSVSAAREFLPLKGQDPTTGSRRLEPGGVTAGEFALDWQIDHRWSADAAASRGFYSDENRRTTLGAGGRYCARLARPRVALDYAWSYTDFDSPSQSYFTPLASAKHTAGISVSGYAERSSLDWGARYQLTSLFSGNFPDLFIHSWSGSVDLVLFDLVPAGIGGYYSIDNQHYSTWGLTVSAQARW
jgi:Flp pilus assembly protein TadD